MRKIKSLFLTVIILTTMCFNVCYAEGAINLLSGHSVSAKDEVFLPSGGVKLEIVNNPHLMNEIRVCNIETDKSVKEYLEEEIKNHTAQIYLGNYNISVTDLMQLINGRYDFMIDNGHIRYLPVDRTVSVESQIIEYFYPIYFFDDEEQQKEAIGFVEDGIAAYVDYVKGITNEPLEQILLVHDIMIANCDYDHTCVDKVETNDNEVSFSALGFFWNKTAVCQGYADAFYLILKGLGIEVGFCNSLKKAHIWNYVELDGKFYHIDTTWDDPLIGKSYNEDGTISVSEIRTTAEHDNFLISDEGFVNHGTREEWYSSYDNKPVCDSVKYEQNHLFNISAPFTIEYKDGYFNAVVNINNRSDVFRTKTLTTDAVIASDGYIESNIYYIFYGFTKDIADTSIIFASEKGEKLQDTKVMIRDVPIPGGTIVDMNVSLSSIPYCDDGNNCFYVWSLETLEPYSKKVYMN